MNNYARRLRWINWQDNRHRKKPRPEWNTRGGVGERDKRERGGREVERHHDTREKSRVITEKRSMPVQASNDWVGSISAIHVRYHEMRLTTIAAMVTGGRRFEVEIIFRNARNGHSFCSRLLFLPVCLCLCSWVRFLRAGASVFFYLRLCDYFMHLSRKVFFVWEFICIVGRESNRSRN